MLIELLQALNWQEGISSAGMKRVTKRLMCRALLFSLWRFVPPARLRIAGLSFAGTGFVMSCIIRCSVITKREEIQFANLIRSGEFQEFLEWDRHFEIADNYLISIALIYMLRAKFSPKQVTFFNLMVALYLAHEVEEEDDNLRHDLIRAAFGSRSVSLDSYRMFMKKKEKLWLATRYNVIVKKEESDSVMNRILRDNYIWRRMRSPITNNRRNTSI